MLSEKRLRMGQETRGRSRRKSLVMFTLCFLTMETKRPSLTMECGCEKEDHTGD